MLCFSVAGHQDRDVSLATRVEVLRPCCRCSQLHTPLPPVLHQYWGQGKEGTWLSNTHGLEDPFSFPAILPAPLHGERWDRAWPQTFLPLPLQSAQAPFLVSPNPCDMSAANKPATHLFVLFFTVWQEFCGLLGGAQGMRACSSCFKPCLSQAGSGSPILFPEVWLY